MHLRQRSAAPDDDPISDAPGHPQHIEIEHLHALSCPRRPAEKFQARCDARVVVEAADIDPVTQALPAIEIDQLVQQLFQRHPMQGIVFLRIVHRSIIVESGVMGAA